MTVDVHGILLLDKPLRMSSAGAVARAKRLFDARKAGHTGSLDPLASGMLPICFGEATKFGAQLLDADKTYRVELRLGERTPTSDLESTVVESREVPPLSSARLVQALAEFPRRYSQVPPMHSALKQDGKPLYAYAREGLTRERAARVIAIRELTLIDWCSPDVTFEVRCSKGTYIRVLGDDLAARLGTIGHLRSLRRMSVAPFEAEPQLTFAELEREPPARLRHRLLPVDAALGACRRLDLAAESVADIRQGRSVTVPATQVAVETVRIYASGSKFVGLAEIHAAGRLVPLRLISSAVEGA